MYPLTQLIDRSLMALSIFIIIIAGQLSNAFHVYDIAVSRIKGERNVDLYSALS